MEMSVLLALAGAPGAVLAVELQSLMLAPPAAPPLAPLAPAKMCMPGQPMEELAARHMELLINHVGAQVVLVGMAGAVAVAGELDHGTAHAAGITLNGIWRRGSE